MAAHHPFASYTGRRTFEPRDELDKIFDTDAALSFASPRHPHAARKFDSVVDRREPKLSESAALSYEHAGAAALVKRRSISYSMGSEERETAFYPQVISQRRGCYR